MLPHAKGEMFFSGCIEFEWKSRMKTDPVIQGNIVGH